MFVIFVIIVESLGIIESAKVLIVVPTPSISHQVVFRPIIEELINHNHEVTVITTDPVYPQGKAPKSLTEIDVNKLSYLPWNKMIRTFENVDIYNIYGTMKTVYRVGSEILEEQLKDKSVQMLINDNTVEFDLIMVEIVILPALIFSHIFKAPVIYMSSFGSKPGVMEAIGGETHPVLYPTHYHERIYNLTTWETIIKLYNHIAFDQMVKKQHSLDDRMLQRLFGVDTPPLTELKNNIHMLFLNIHPSWVHNQPVPSNVVYTWGIHKTPAKILPMDLQYYLDSSKHGVIYISFGTNVKSSLISPDNLEILLKVFSQLPYNILWKWDLDELPGKSKNIKISKWFPQVDILRHPNLKLFVTQGGLQSTEEAINSGVPLIGIPVFSDQAYNTEKYVHFKIGIRLDFKSLTVEKFENAIKTILTDESYRINIIKLRTQMHDQSKPALENAIWWIEYVLRHGGVRHLRTPAANMSWTQYYEVELIIIIFSVLIILSSVLLLTMYYCYKCLQRVGLPSIWDSLDSS